MSVDELSVISCDSLGSSQLYGENQVTCFDNILYRTRSKKATTLNINLDDYDSQELAQILEEGVASSTGAESGSHSEEPDLLGYEHITASNKHALHDEKHKAKDKIKALVGVP